MAIAPLVAITGMNSLRRDLRKVATTLPRDVKLANRAIAEDVAIRARARAASLGGVHAHTASGVRAGATQALSRITLDASRQPALFGAEFGGGRRPTTRQFPPWRGAGRNTGYFVYPTIYDRRRSIVRQYEEQLSSIVKKAGL